MHGRNNVWFSPTTDKVKAIDKIPQCVFLQYMSIFSNNNKSSLSSTLIWQGRIVLKEAFERYFVDKSRRTKKKNKKHFSIGHCMS